MDKVAALMPSRIEEAINATPISMLTKVVDRRNLEAFLCSELIKLKAMINVDDRLNLQSHQIPMIAQTLIDHYPNESLPDFTICFKRGAMGLYDDKLLRLDGSIVMHWMAKYLDEKYQAIETKLMKEKDPFAGHGLKEGFTGKTYLDALIEAVGYDPTKAKPSNNSEENYYQREKLDYQTMTNEEIIVKEMHFRWIAENFDKNGNKLEGFLSEAEWLKR